MTTIRLVERAHDTELARTLDAANNPEAGVVVFRTAPDVRRAHEFGQDLLAALGKDHDVTGSGRNARNDWELIAAWLTAYPVDTIVLLDAQWVPASLLDALILLTTMTGADLWLVARARSTRRHTRVWANAYGPVLTIASTGPLSLRDFRVSLPRFPAVNDAIPARVTARFHITSSRW